MKLEINAYNLRMKRSTLLKVLFLILFIFLTYTILMVYVTGNKSVALQKEFTQKQLKGNSVDKLTDAFGEPQMIKYGRDMVESTSGDYIPRGPYHSVLMYYTNVTILNKVGYFPGGGTKVYVDQNDIVTGIDPYLE